MIAPGWSAALLHLLVLLAVQLSRSSKEIASRSIPAASAPTSKREDLSSSDVSAASSIDRYVIGIDCGTESVRVGVFCCRTGRLMSSSHSVYETKFPRPGWAEQNPSDWWRCLGAASSSAILQAKNDHAISSEQIRGVCLDTTACSVVALDDDYRPLRPCLLWMDARSADQTSAIMMKAKDDPALQLNCAGEGPLSAEWMIPKALWIKHQEPDIWNRAIYICEKQDYLNFLLTGRFCASGCNVAARWHWDGEESCYTSNSATRKGSQRLTDEQRYRFQRMIDALPDATDKDSDDYYAFIKDLETSFPGRPVSLLHRMNALELLLKWPTECISMGDMIGSLTSEAAAHTGLPQGIPLFQGGPDAYVGMVGLGCISPTEGKLALITGSSHLHLCVTQSGAKGAKGVWGPYSGAPMLGLQFAEGGQSSTGSVMSWARRLFSSQYGCGEDNLLEFDKLNAEAAEVPIGCDGLVSMATFQGARTPVTDPLMRGGIFGLTLSHTRGHIWRSLLESICLGTRAAVDALRAAGYSFTEISMAGGATRSPFWLQMHADVTGLPVAVGEIDNAPMLGAAVLAAAGIEAVDATSIENELRRTGRASNRALMRRKRVESAVKRMVHEAQRIKPSITAHKAYSDLFGIYNNVARNLAPLCHKIAKYSPLSSNTDAKNVEWREELATPLQRRVRNTNADPRDVGALPSLPSGRKAVVMPSILAADFGYIAAEAQRCVEAGARWLHIDVCDGNSGCPGSLTLGPQSVHAIRRACPELLMDVHIVSDNSMDIISPLIQAGATRITLQYEQFLNLAPALGNSNIAIELLANAIHKIRSLGAQVGLCIAPNTSDTTLFNTLDCIHHIQLQRNRQHKGENQLPPVDCINVLAVNPGFGGQDFNSSVMVKVRSIYDRYPHLPFLQVDGGVSSETASKAVQAGANVLIAGSGIFGKNRYLDENSPGDYSLKESFSSLLSELLLYGR